MSFVPSATLEGRPDASPSRRAFPSFPPSPTSGILRPRLRRPASGCWSGTSSGRKVVSGSACALGRLLAARGGGGLPRESSHACGGHRLPPPATPSTPQERVMSKRVEIVLVPFIASKRAALRDGRDLLSSARDRKGGEPPPPPSYGRSRRIALHSRSAQQDSGSLRVIASATWRIHARGQGKATCATNSRTNPRNVPRRPNAAAKQIVARLTTSRHRARHRSSCLDISI